MANLGDGGFPTDYLQSEAVLHGIITGIVAAFRQPTRREQLGSVLALVTGMSGIALPDSALADEGLWDAIADGVLAHLESVGATEIVLPA